MRDWGDTTNEKAIVEIRCVSQKCGWCGDCLAVRSHGSWSWSIENCPQCTSAVEEGDWHRDVDN